MSSYTHAHQITCRGLRTDQSLTHTTDGCILQVGTEGNDEGTSGVPVGLPVFLNPEAFSTEHSWGDVQAGTMVYDAIKGDVRFWNGSCWLGTSTRFTTRCGSQLSGPGEWWFTLAPNDSATTDEPPTTLMSTVAGVGFWEILPERFNSVDIDLIVAADEGDLGEATVRLYKADSGTLANHTQVVEKDFSVKNSRGLFRELVVEFSEPLEAGTAFNVSLQCTTNSVVGFSLVLTFRNT